MRGPLFLGLDIGTSKVAAVILDRDRALRSVRSVVHNASRASPAGRSEQDPDGLLRAARSAIRALPSGERKNIAAIGLTGQMHGVILFDNEVKPLTPLVTWQDGRCLEDNYLEELVDRIQSPLFSGYGAATLAWYRDRGEWPAAAVSAATIQDAAAAILTGGARPVCDPTDAASWGLFDLDANAWDLPAWRRIGVPPEILPAVVKCGQLAGGLCPRFARELGLPAGAPVAAAIGDHQASLLATLRDAEKELALTLGTGGQLSAVMPAEHAAGDAPGCEWRPYPGGLRVATAAALCGGSAWSWLVASAASWLQVLGCDPIPEEELFRRLNALGLAANDELAVRPNFHGERHDPSLRGLISGITLDNFDPGRIGRATARGIFENLKSMMPRQALAGRVALVGSGNALRRNPLLQEMATRVFALPLRLSERAEEAACGAAINAAVLA